MLNKKEKAVMWIVYDRAIKKDDSCIISEEEINEKLDEKLRTKFVDGEIAKTLEFLEYDGYYELVKSQKKEQQVYVVRLREKGQAFPREMQQAKRAMTWRIVSTVGFSALGAAVALLIRAIF
jgi:hypothetical protein